MRKGKVDGGVYSESVRVRTSEDTIKSFVPRKGIDVVFTPVYEDEGNKPGNKEWNVLLTGSDIMPETSITQRELINELSKWKSIVSDRVRRQRKEPLKFKITTNVEREMITKEGVTRVNINSDILNSRLDRVEEKDITVGDNGKRCAEICNDEIKE